MRVFIENEAGSFVKHIYNEKTLVLTRTTQVSRAYPFPYGFLPNTIAADGDNVDCFVLTNKPLKTGQVVQCQPIGLMEQIEDGEVDHKVLAVLDGEDDNLSDNARARLVEFASHVFDHIPGKSMQIGSFRNRDAALAYARQHEDKAGTG